MSDIFCKIIKKEVPAFIIGENDDAVAFLDHEPFSPGHTLVISKEHADDIFDLSDEQLSNIFRLAKQIAKKMRQIFEYENIVFMSNNGKDIQDVKHFHLHVTGKDKEKVSDLYKKLSFEDIQKKFERF